ncbi:MAG: hypothetical protein KA354_05845 [Phycisphaerae bacterium]|nr:hypothetical protein [Phycisphaerae bacterium]
MVLRVRFLWRWCSGRAPFHAFVAGVMAAIWAFEVPVQAAAEIRFKVVDGRPCAMGTIHGPSKGIPANVVIELGLKMPLVIHERSGKLLEIGGDSRGEVRFGDLALGNLKTHATGLKELEDLSRDYAPELGEIPAIAYLGLPAFEQFGVQIEIGEGVLRLLPGEEAVLSEGERSGSDGVSKATVVPYEESGSGYWLKAVAADGFTLRTRFMTSGNDTIIDSTAADLAGSAGGAIDPLSLGGLNLARLVAFRPEDLSEAPEPRPDLVLGVNLLSSLRVTIDQTHRRMLFEQTREPRFPIEERAYYQARTDGNAEAIESFVKGHATSRLAKEAAEKLLALRLEDTAGPREAITRAVRMRADLTPENRRAASLVTLADALIAGKRTDKYELATEVLKIGQESASTDLNGVAAHQILARTGQIALQRNDLKEARRALLSAAFGLPRDPLVNLWLGELYERTGKAARAWSRFVQAAISDDAPADAFRGLDRLNRDADFRASFSMGDAEQLLEGRVPAFHPADRFGEGGKGEDAKPVQLVELFTCVDHGSTAAPELAFGGLQQYFDGTDVSWVQYHLASPAAEPLVSRASVSRAGFYQTTTAPAAFFDGKGPKTDAGDEKNAAQVYAAYQGAALAGRVGVAAWKVDGRIAFTEGKFVGIIEVQGSEAGGSLRLHVILCERLVMLPAANGVVLHRSVARALLSPEGGFELPAGSGGRSYEVMLTVAAVSEELDKRISAVEAEKEVRFLMRPFFVDPGACVVVAFLQDSRTREVLVARSLAVKNNGAGGGS